ncbi:hypothetical protein C2S51_023895 [Perilla frutescens var. frutescens]|nr:hypothetical protein C2S51_023895 [Perilla frutescens var. frutescens]
MALAEARAALHRTANRCLVQEDAKRAPKLACCSSVPTCVKQADTVSSASGGQDVPGAVSNLNPSFSHLSPNSKWWLYLQPNYGYQKGSMDEQFTSMEINQKHESSGALARNEDNPGLIDQTSCKKLSCGRTMETSDKLEFGVKEDGLRPFSSWNCQDPLKIVEDVCPEVPKGANEPCFDPGSSWIGDEKNVPWWRTADTDELASLVAQRSLDYIENCDLPWPQNARVKKDVGVNICCFGHDGIPNHHYSSRLHTARSPTSGCACQKRSPLVEGEQDKPSRDDIPNHETMGEMHMYEKDASKARLMEALCHSQTRAREAERAAKQACAEKEHVVKLVFRQASQLFAYKQWLQLLQLESIYLHFLNNSSEPLVLQNTKETQTTRRYTTSSTRKRAEQCHPQYEAVVVAIGLGLAGAGFLLGWTIAQMFPSW